MWPQCKCNDLLEKDRDSSHLFNTCGACQAGPVSVSTDRRSSTVELLLREASIRLCPITKMASKVNEPDDKLQSRERSPQEARNS